MYAVVNSENIVIQLLNCGRVVSDNKTYSAAALAGLSQAEKDALGLKLVTTDPQPEYDDETQKITLNQLKKGDVFAAQSWSIVTLSDAEHNAVIEGKLLKMDSQDMPRACEDIINALTASGYDITAELPQATKDKKAAKEAERAKIRK